MRQQLGWKQAILPCQTGYDSRLTGTFRLPNTLLLQSDPQHKMLWQTFRGLRVQERFNAQGARHRQLLDILLMAPSQ